MHRAQLEDKLAELYAKDSEDDILFELTEVQLDLNLEADKEECYWEQRAHVNWLVNGDKNTTFFHKMASNQKRCNMIMGLEDRDDIWVTDEMKLLDVAMSYFEDILIASEVTDAATILRK